MAAPPRAPTPAASRGGWVVAALVGLVALPVGVAVGLAWFDFTEPVPGEIPQPVWVTPDTIRATSSDGVAVKTKVSIDVVDSSTRSSVERRLGQVGLLLQATVAAKSRQEMTGAVGLEGLAADMLERLNDYLAQEDVRPARAVVVQDFLFSPP